MHQKQAFSLPVYATEDFAIFGKLAGNRELDRNHVRRLAKAIEQDPSLTEKNPILVNEHMEVIDGQHRIAAYKLVATKSGGLSEPLYYIVKEGLTLADTRKMNAGAKAWKPLDYAVAYALEGNKHYKAYVKLHERYPDVPHHAITVALGGFKDTGLKEFRHGLFTLSRSYEEAENLVRKLMEVDAILGTGPSTALSLAYMKRVVSHPNYDHERMLESLAGNNKDTILRVPQRYSEISVAFNVVYNMGGGPLVDLLSPVKESGKTLYRNQSVQIK